MQLTGITFRNAMSLFEIVLLCSFHIIECEGQHDLIERKVTLGTLLRMPALQNGVLFLLLLLFQETALKGGAASLLQKTG